MSARLCLPVHEPVYHTEPFQQDQFWHYAAEFKTNTGRQLGVKLTRRAPGVGKLEV